MGVEAFKSTSGRVRTRARQVLALAAVVEIAAALYALLLGGFHVVLGPLRLSAGGPTRPFTIGAACACAAIALRDRESVRASWDAIAFWSRGLAAAASLAVLVAGVSLGAFAAGGSDQYGYVSQAISWAAGQLRISEPLAALDPSIAQAAVPLGYQLSSPDTIVSIYSPGLPLMMAPLVLVGGEQAVYVVVPLLGAVGVWLTYVLGSRIWGERAGLLAALGLACSPVFLHQLFLPMSDVPATTLWLAALVLALSGARGAPAAAGLVVSLALLTRPNLLPLAAPLAVVIWIERRRAADLLVFVLALLPGPLAIAILYRMLYGSVLMSGYGGLDTLFRLEWLGENARRYGMWLVETQSPVILLGVAALAVRRTTVTFALFGYCLVVGACYLLYIPFDGWHFVRFLLPAIPVLLILSAGVLETLIQRLPPSWRGTTFVALCAAMAVTYLTAAHRHGVFDVGQDQRRFLSIGRFLGRELPENAIVIAGLHSGSMRLYGHRPTLRWTQMTPPALDPAVALLRAKGFEPYILLESDEEREFRGWFGSSSGLGALDWAPAYEYLGHPRASVYAVSERSSPGQPRAAPKVIPAS
jgi:hypothetical protein